ncbi:MAG: DNA polymerase IV [Candidatus Magasanikbacteria bacterium RIFCSPHIGHO2_01_FULL_50_8]|uniref:DNA polymerase IV n=1 Tax=Candidatus Magasanikbacteria bacterium RIFCSPHIGHO2_01_FULL_50_8 TaxID=1798674 RepID=A0A1F6LRP7_9BACT|nr:MAG: DNA polymerase IV [Candidatus Magasanikbacteria bacterium RIFCSPHIGHO2_01_FULL_50_8]
MPLTSIGLWQTSPHLQSFPRAIVHIDGDAFFASCETALHPELRGRPVVTGRERGIASSLSYEAKARGVVRGMMLSDVRRVCPDAVILPSDYETYSLFSKRMFAIMRRFTSVVEEYGIDEGFAEITGLRGPLHMGYEEIARAMKTAIDAELGFTVSVGLAPTKSLAKIASKWQKPNGFTSVPGRAIRGYLSALGVEKIWGVGPNTAAHLRSLGIFTALEFIERPFEFVVAHFNKPHQEMWHELNGVCVWPVVTEEKSTYASISKTKTFTPPSGDVEFLMAQLTRNLENACIKARRHGLVARRLVVYLRTQQFSHAAAEAKITRASNFPHDLLPHVRTLVEEIFRRGVLYRATGVVLADLSADTSVQSSLFESPVRMEKLQRVYAAIDALDAAFGKHTVHLGGSQKTFSGAQFLGNDGRSRATAREQNLLQGETARQRVRIPRMIMSV